MGKPRVNYLEAITQRVTFDYLHKKQSGAQRVFTACPMSCRVVAMREVTPFSACGATMRPAGTVPHGIGDNLMHSMKHTPWECRRAGAVWPGGRLHGALARGLAREICL